MKKDRIYEVNCIVFKRVGDSSKDVRFLLLKRIPKKGGFWQPVTGRVHQDEVRIKAIKREIREETGIKVKEIKGIINTNYSFQYRDNDGDKVREYVYGVEIIPKQEITISKEHTKFKWVTLREALKLLKYESNKKGFRVLFKMIKNEKRDRNKI